MADDLSWLDPLSILSSIPAPKDTYKVARGADAAGTSSSVGAGNSAKPVSFWDQISIWIKLLVALLAVIVVFILLRSLRIL